MNEQFPSTQKTKSFERSKEEQRLREIIQQLEESSKQHPRDDSYEEKILSTEEQLRKAEINHRYTQTASKDVPSSNHEGTHKVENSGSEDTRTSETPHTESRKEKKDSKKESTAESSPTKKSPDSRKDTAQKNAEVAGVGTARRRMLEAEAAYLGAYRKHLSGSEQHNKQHVEQLREEYNQARVLFSQQVNTSVEERLNEKERGVASLSKTKDRDIILSRKHRYAYDNPERKAAVKERYNQMILSHDVIVRAEKERTLAKKEALDEKGRGVFSKALGWYSSGNKVLEKKFGKTGARAVRIVTFATIGGAAGGVAVVGHRIIRSALGAVVGTGAGVVAGKLYKKYFGRKSSENLREVSGRGIKTLQGLKIAEKAYKKGSKEAIERKQHIAEAITAFVVGAGVSVEAAHIIAGMPSMNAPEAHVVEVNPAGPSASALVQGPSISEHATPAIQEALAHIDQRGEGSDALFGSLKERLHEMYPDPNNAPPEVQHILHTRLHELSEEYGFAKSPTDAVPGQSALMHMKDTLKYNPTTGHLSFDGHILASDATGHIEKGATFDQFNDHYTIDKEPSASAALASATSEHTAQGVAPPQEGLQYDNGGADGNLFEQQVRPEDFNPQSAHDAVEQTTSSLQESIPQSHDTVTQLLNSPEWSKYSDAQTADILYGASVPYDVHSHLINVIEHSGIGPHAGETTQHFLERAEQAITNNHENAYEVSVDNLKIPLGQTHIYMDTHQVSTVFGGSYDAREVLAHQYLLENPGARVLLVDAQGTQAHTFSLASGIAGHSKGVIGTTAYPINPHEFITALPRGKTATW